MGTPKIFQTGGMRLNQTRDPQISSGGGWTDEAAEQSLVGNYAFPYETFENEVAIATEEDNSVTTNAFASTPRKIGQTVENPLTFYDRFSGMDRFHYWMWGFENDVKRVMVFKGVADPWSASEPAPGVEYEDATSGTTQKFTYLRAETVRYDDGTTSYLYVFAIADGVTAPDPTPAGNLTEVGDSATFAYTAHSGAKYEHLFELDANGRRRRAFTAAEQAMDDYQAGLKNLMATFGKRMEGYDIMLLNAMSKSFNWKVDAAGLARYDTSYMAYKERREETPTSSGWVLPAALGNNDNVPAHFQTRFEIGLTPASLVTLGMSNISVGVDTPLQSLQTTTSGVHIEEPLIEGKYAISLTGTIGRHGVSTYQQYRDAQTKVVAKVTSNGGVGGYDLMEMLFKECTFTKAGPGSEDVAAEQLDMPVGYVHTDNDPWKAGWLYGNSQINNSPVVMRTRNDYALNSMFLEEA